ncbi:MAG TPA: hypothetical protein DIT32_03020 [Peptococcaceae bacterium]|nr:hypothetical protein [Peptococcaceae bacterium]
MVQLFKRLTRLVLGLMVYGLGIVMTMKANLGYAPWEVFHSGVGMTVGLSIGTISILAGACFVLLAALLGEKIGLGTLLNMILIGVFTDFFLFLDMIEIQTWLPLQFLWMMAGLFTIAFASYLYIGSGFGAGPRDSLMVVLMRRTGLPVGTCRIFIEGSAVLIGWFLGGPVGFGTVMAALGSGVCIQSVFYLRRFDAAKVKQESLEETLKQFSGKQISLGKQS